MLNLRTSFYFSSYLSLLCSFGFISFFRLINNLIISVTYFATRPLINHIRLFLKRTNRCFVTPKLLVRLFFLAPSTLWISLLKGEPVFLEQRLLRGVCLAPIYGLVT